MIQESFSKLLKKLDFIRSEDGEKERKFFTKTFKRMVDLLGEPFASETFDFSNKAYFEKIYQLGDEISNDKLFKKSNSARGSKHGIYIKPNIFWAL